MGQPTCVHAPAFHHTKGRFKHLSQVGRPRPASPAQRSLEPEAPNLLGGVDLAAREGHDEVPALKGRVRQERGRHQGRVSSFPETKPQKAPKLKDAYHTALNPKPFNP